MALSFTHTFVCGIADDATAQAAGEILPSHWNAALSTSMATAKVLGRATAGTGAIEELGTTGTGDVVLAVAPTITGHPTIEGVTATGATGTGKFVFDTSPTLITPLLGTPTSGTLTNCTGLPAAGVVGTAAVIGANTFTSAQAITNSGASSLVITRSDQSGFTSQTQVDLKTSAGTSKFTIGVHNNGTDIGGAGTVAVSQVFQFASELQAAGIKAVFNNTSSCGTTANRWTNVYATALTAIPASSNGQSVALTSLTELLTIAAAATSTTTIQIPAGAIVVSVNVRVTTAVTCTSTFTVGDGTTADKFNTAAVSKAVNSTDKGTKAGAVYYAAATSIIITPDTVPSDATGRVRVTIAYIEATAPTS